MKKKIAACLAFVLLAQNLVCFGTYAAVDTPGEASAMASETVTEAETETVAADFSGIESFRLLELLGVVTEDDLRASSTLTRQDFVDMVVRMMNIKSTTSKRYFDDAEVGNAANTFAELGYLKVGDDRRFRPGDPITLTEGYIILLRTLGYEKYVTALGGQPFDYRRVSRIIELETISGEKSEITAADACEMMWRALLCRVYDIVGIGSDGAIYTESETLLERVWDIVCIEGYLAAKDTVSVYKNTEAPGKGRITIADVVLDCEEGVCDDVYMGSFVCAYVKKTHISGSDIHTARLVMCRDDVTKVYEYTSVDFVSAKGDELTLEMNGRKKRFNIGTSALVRNGAVDPNAGTSDIRSLASEDNAEIVLIDNPEKSGVEFVYINTFTDAEIRYINPDEGYVSAKDAAGILHKVKISDENCSDCAVYLRDGRTGERISADSLKTGGAISFFKSDDESVVTVYSLTNIVNGMVSIFTEVNDRTVVTVDGAKLRVAKSLVSGTVSVGMKGSFTLNVIGDITVVSADTDGWNFGYIQDFACEEKPFDKEMEYLIYTEEGLSILKCAKNYTLDGKNTSADHAIADKIAPEGTIKDELHLIRFKKNSNNELINVDTATLIGDTPEGEDTLMVIGNAHERVYHIETIFKNIYIDADTWNSGNRTRGTNAGENRVYRYPLYSNTKVFTVPSDGNSDDVDFSYMTIGNGYTIADNEKSKYVIYTVGDTSSLADVVVRMRPRSAETTEKTQGWLVNDSSITLLDSEGEIRSAIQVITCRALQSTTKSVPLASNVTVKKVNGEEVTVSDNDAVSMISPGDVVMFGDSKDGLVHHIRVLYDYDADDPNSPDDDNRGQVYWGWLDSGGNKLDTYTYRYTNYEEHANETTTVAFGAYGYLLKRVFDVDNLRVDDVWGNSAPKSYVVLGEARTEGSGVVSGSAGWNVGYGRLAAFDASRRSNPAYYSIFTDCVDYESSQTEYDYVLLLSGVSSNLGIDAVFYRR